MYRIYADDVLFYDTNLSYDEDYYVISPKLTMELNKAGSLEFILPPSNVVYNTLQKLKTTIHVYDDSGLEIFRGRVLHDEKDFYNRKQVYIEGALSFLTDGVVRPYSYSGSVQRYVQMLMDTQRGEVEQDRRILYTVASDPVEDPNQYIVRSNSEYENVWNEISNKVLGSFGGYLKLSYGRGASLYAIFCQYANSYGSISDQVIKFGENLLDIKEYITAENIFTVLIPLGKKTETSDGTEGERLTIKSVNSGNDYLVNQTAVNLFGKIWRTNIWDDVTIASNLKTKGTEFLNQNIEMSVTLSIKAVDLHYIDVDTERIHLGDQIRVVSEPHELDTYFLCSKVVFYFDDPSKDEYTLGVGFSGLTDKQIENEKKTAESLGIAESAMNTISNVSVNVSGNYVSSAEFSTFQTAVNNNFRTVNEKLTSVFHYKGTVSSVSNLPSSGNVVGDVWNVTDTGANYAWSGSEWDKLSENTINIDLSGYVELSDFNALVQRVVILEQGSSAVETITASLANGVLTISGFQNDPTITFV